MIDLLVDTVHKIGVRSKRKVVAGIARDIEKVYGKEWLLFDIAGDSVASPEGRVRDGDFPGGRPRRAYGDRQGTSGEGHTRTPNLPRDARLLRQSLQTVLKRLAFPRLLSVRRRYDERYKEQVFA